MEIQQPLTNLSSLPIGIITEQTYTISDTLHSLKHRHLV